MLNHEQFKVIMNKVDLTVVDLILIGDHLEYIEELQKQYGETMPIDVGNTLIGDVEAIVERLNCEHKKLKEKNKKLDRLKIV